MANMRDKTAAFISNSLREKLGEKKDGSARRF